MESFTALESVRRFEQEMLDAQQRLADERVDGQDQAGRVKVKLTGQMRVKRVRILDEELLAPERAKDLERALTEALDVAVAAARDLAARRAVEVASTVGLG